MPWRNKRYPLSNESRDYVNNEFIHLPGIEKGGNKFSPTPAARLSLETNYGD